jgi:hypothetical protein
MDESLVLVGRTCLRSSPGPFAGHLWVELDVVSLVVLAVLLVAIVPSLLAAAPLVLFLIVSPLRGAPGEVG